MNGAKLCRFLRQQTAKKGLAMHWVLLTGAIITEVIGTLALKSSAGFTILLPSAIVIFGYAASFWLLALALRVLDVGTAYAIWAGAGTALISIAGIILFKEPATVQKTSFILMIIFGVGGLHVVESK